MQENMQEICREYAKKYAVNMQNMQEICEKICRKYAGKYAVNMQ